MTRDLGPESLRRWTWRSSRPDANLRSRVQLRAVRLSLEVREDRTTPSTFLVTNAVDPRVAVVPGSLRWAINQANKPQNQGSVVAITSSVGSTISGNIATGSGGGIWNGNGLVINNTLVTGNKAGAPGGGILNKGPFTSKNNNITNNSPDNVASLPG